MSDGQVTKLIMSSNGLGWLKAEPVRSAEELASILAALGRARAADTAARSGVDAYSFFGPLCEHVHVTTSRDLAVTAEPKKDAAEHTTTVIGVPLKQAEAQVAKLLPQRDRARIVPANRANKALVGVGFSGGAML